MHSPRATNWVNFDFRVSDKKAIDFYLSSDSEGSEDSDEEDDDDDEDA